MHYAALTEELIRMMYENPNQIPGRADQRHAAR